VPCILCGIRKALCCVIREDNIRVESIERETRQVEWIGWIIRGGGRGCVAKGVRVAVAAVSLVGMYITKELSCRVSLMMALGVEIWLFF
jgi:hypothetical protein